MAPKPGEKVPTPCLPSTCKSRIRMTRVSPGSAPSMKNGTVKGLSPLTSDMLSPGFCSALPKQSSELASRVSPGFRCATGGATPKTYFTLSMVARYCTTSFPEFCGAESCARAKDGTMNDRSRKRDFLGMGESLQSDPVSATQDQTSVKSTLRN